MYDILPCVPILCPPQIVISTDSFDQVPSTKYLQMGPGHVPIHVHVHCTKSLVSPPRAVQPQVIKICYSVVASSPSLDRVDRRMCICKTLPNTPAFWSRAWDRHILEACHPDAPNTDACLG